MDNERVSRVREAMRREKLGLLVCRMPENVLFLSGHWPLAGVTVLLFPADGDPVCILPQTEEREARQDLGDFQLKPYPYGTLTSGDPDASLHRLLSEQAARLSPQRIGFEGDFTTMAPPWNAAEPAIPARAVEALFRRGFPGAEFIDATPLLLSLRSRKTAAEAERLRMVNEIAAFGLEAFAAAVAPGIRGIDLVATVESAVLLRGTGHKGARRVRAFAQVATGAAETSIGWRPSEVSSDRKMEAGDIALLELAVVADGYWSDRTRTRIAGKATEGQRRLFDAIALAQATAIKAVRPGVRAGDVDAAARNVLEAAGFGKEFLHITGHGTGFRYHEPHPILAPGSDEILEEGMVFSVEPGAYSEAMGGMRIEDNVLVTGIGAEVLGPAERSLTK